EHRLVELLAGADDRVAGALHELVDRPVVDGDPDDRAPEQSALLEPVQRVERHHLGQVPGDPEDHEHIRRAVVRRRASHGASPLARSAHSSSATLIRPTRWCVSSLPAQSTTAFARSSFVGRSARCTARQANCALCPFIVLPPSIWTTAALRPIAAIVPLSRYANGFVALPATRRAIDSPACSPDWSATEPSCGSTCCTFASVIAAMSPTTKTPGWPGSSRSGPTAIRSPRCSSIPSDRTSLLPWRPAPQTSVCAGITSPEASVTRVGETDCTRAPVTTSTVRFSSASRAYFRRFGLNIAKISSPASTRTMRTFSCGMVGESFSTLRRYSSASAPAVSTPVGPPPTTTALSAPSSTRLASLSAASQRSSTWFFSLSAWGRVYIGKACSAAPSVPKNVTSAPSASTR